MYVPEFKGPIEGYVVNSLKTNYWRIAETHTREDAMQEAWVVFMRCCARYPIIDTPQNFMSLFKRAWINQLNDLANATTRHRALIPEAEDESGNKIHEPVGETENAGYLTVLVHQAPREVLMVLNLFLNAPTELLELAAKAWSAGGHRNVDGNAMLARLLGTDPKADLIGKVRDHFNS